MGRFAFQNSLASNDEERANPWLLLHRDAQAGTREVLLQHRAEWSHHGGTWGLLGGARHRVESALEAALREAAEEGGLQPEGTRATGEYVDEHGGWSYATVLAAARVADIEARPTGGESIDVRWVKLEAVDELALHPGFALSWPMLREAIPGLGDQNQLGSCARDECQGRARLGQFLVANLQGAFACQ